MRCFRCRGGTITVYSVGWIAKYCEKCDWTGHIVKIPEAIK